MKRGFTLIELLAVTVLLGLIMAVSYPALFKIFDDTEEELDSNKKQIVENIAINYAKKNINDFNEGDNCLFLNKLIAENELVDENLNNRIIKITLNNEKYSAEILDENETCQADKKIYEVKQCTKNLSNSKYNLTDEKITFSVDNVIIKQIDIVEGENTNNKVAFTNEMNSYYSLANVLKNNANFIINMDKNQEYFKMYTEITSPNDVILTEEEKNALENASIFYNLGTIKTTC